MLLELLAFQEAGVHRISVWFKEFRSMIWLESDEHMSFDILRNLCFEELWSWKEIGKESVKDKCQIDLTCCRIAMESTWVVSWNRHMPQLNQLPYLHGWTFMQKLWASLAPVWCLSSWLVYSLVQVDHEVHPFSSTYWPFLCISELGIFRTGGFKQNRSFIVPIPFFDQLICIQPINFKVGRTCEVNPLKTL